ncbi:uncharacterized protein NP_1830A [Natronomonas pharaonis DSM 2160]|uniref:DUF8052 domain-containing protein n=1 Tax=Natronomonas pharaonis (strain ATCC 35678 / DSM 2160 / CIP 103997 / JCM 8858 / NBRC 14720 / NCIMB 2260 / Gabara) TaxID=348780 RepID=A0A1U7EVG2_NATPD|nr:hypothetical protein [Natronomonas pharaonis]CAI49006.2 uncharacterized protein NP_1830A [Natronomonas pharaonis DSM 2160]
MSQTETEAGAEAPAGDDIPVWDDEYIEAVSKRLCHHYDLEKNRRVEGTTFSLYGEMVLENTKHFLHPAITIARHESREHLFVQRVAELTEADLDRLVATGHALADEWIDADGEHYSTEFTFVTVVPSLSEDVRSAVQSLDERTLLKYGYHGHYEVNLIVVAPDAGELVANEGVDVAEAFATWDEIERTEPGLLQLVARRLQL